MRIYVKSAGKRPSQDYKWLAVEPIGSDCDADKKCIAMAEMKVASKGRVAEFSDNPKDSPPRFSLFLGNVDSGRSDFYGTPILNRVGFVFDGRNSKDIQYAQNIFRKWNTGDSALEDLIARGITASNCEIGFAVTPDFAKSIDIIANSSIDQKTVSDTDIPVSRGTNALADNETLTKMQSQGGQMRIFVNTVASGESDYGWYVNRRPPYANRLCKVCEPVRAATADRVFFASLSREQNSWVVFVQDIIGEDLRTVRLARGTIAIEIPDSMSDASSFVRRLLYAWLMPNGKLLKAFKDHIDTSGDEVCADMPALLSAVESIGRDTSVVLKNEGVPQGRILRRINEDRANVDELRREAADFVSTHVFPEQSGVQFLFTNFGYSSQLNSYEPLPEIPAKYIVAGYREGERGTLSSTLIPSPTPPRNQSGDTDKGAGDVSGKPKENIVACWVVAAIAVFFCVFLLFRGCRKSTEGNRATDDVQMTTNTDESIKQ